MPQPEGQSRCAGPNRCDRSTKRAANRCCKTRRPRRSISATTIEHGPWLISASPYSTRAAAIRSRISRAGFSSPNDDQHPPVNFHAYAACTGGVFHRETKRAIAAGQPVLLLLRGDFKETGRALRELKTAGLPVAVSLKETGLHQIEKQLRDPETSRAFSRYRAGGRRLSRRDPGGHCVLRSRRIHPDALSDERNALGLFAFVRGKRGIFIGTREWEVPSRHHLAALAIALGLGEPVTVFEAEPRRCRKLLGALGVPLEKLRLIDSRLPYRDYLAEMARHKIVLQADKSAVPGQVAGDALLCRMPCVGGDGAIDRSAFRAPRALGVR